MVSMSFRDAMLRHTARSVPVKFCEAEAFSPNMSIVLHSIGFSRGCYCRQSRPEQNFCKASRLRRRLLFSSASP